MKPKFLGSSDPYVKFKWRQKLVYKSNTIFKNLNPNWDEKFSLLIDDLHHQIEIDVFDYDRFASDDFMGSCRINLANLELKKTNEMKLLLGAENSDAYMGYLLFDIRIIPQTAEDKEAVSPGFPFFVKLLRLFST